MKVRSLLLLGLLLATPVLADGDPAGRFPTTKRMPKNSCDGTFGDPVVVSGAAPFSVAWDDDVRVATPRGEFVLTRIHAGDTAALGQTLPDAADEACRASLLSTRPGLMKSPFGGDFLPGLEQRGTVIHSLSALVDTRCPTNTRLLTPNGDVRFFAPLPSLSPGASAWVPRAATAQSEPSRLKAFKSGSGALSFSWYHEDGRRFDFEGVFAGSGPNGQYRLVRAYGTDGLLFFSVQYGYPPLVAGESPPAHLSDGGVRLYSPHTDEDSNCGGAGIVCALGTYCVAGTCVPHPSSCMATVEPQSVSFPNTDLRLLFLYGNFGSVFSSGGLEYPISDCSLRKVQLGVVGGPVETLVDYQYVTGVHDGVASQWMSAARFAAEAGENGWASLQPWPLDTHKTWSLAPLVMHPWEGPIPTSVMVSEMRFAHDYNPGEYGPYIKQNNTATARVAGTVSQTLNSAVCASSVYGVEAEVLGDGDYAIHRRYFYWGSDDAGVDGVVDPSWNAAFGALPAKEVELCANTPFQCAGGSSEHFYGRASTGGGLDTQGQCGTSSTPTVEVALRDKLGAFEKRDVRFSASRGGTFELVGESRGDSSLASSSPLVAAGHEYGYAPDGTQWLLANTRPSLFGGTTETRLVRDGDGLVTAVVQTGKTLVGTSVVTRSVGTFFRRRVASCSGASGPEGAVVAIEGPCYLDGPTATSCSTSAIGRGSAAYVPQPSITEFYFYPGGGYDGEGMPTALASLVTAARPFDSGRLLAVRVYPSGCASTFLETTFGRYSAAGEPLEVTGPAGGQTMKWVNGGVLTQMMLPGGELYSFDWDRGRLWRTRRPEGDAVVSCTESYAPTSSSFDMTVCRRAPEGWIGPVVGQAGKAADQQSTAGALHGTVAWVAESSDMAMHAPLRRKTFKYTVAGSLVSESVWGADWSGLTDPMVEVGPLEKQSHHQVERDIDERVSLEWYGNRGATMSSPGATDWYGSTRHDAESNVIMLAAGLDFRFSNESTPPTAFCVGAWPDGLDSRCTSLSRDLLGRLVGTKWGGLSADLLSYDAHGNISVVAQGCDEGTAPPTTPTTAGASGVTGGPECGLRHEYVWDDFGHLVLFRTPVGTGYAATRYEYAATGAVSVQETEVQRGVGEALTFVRDGLGRQRAVRSSSAGATTTLSSQEWDVAPTMPPSTCAGSLAPRAQGALAYSEDPVWSRWYSYDVNGRLIEERRVRRELEDCFFGSLLESNTTNYSYTPNGNLSTVKYPSGRTVRYLYDSVETNLPSGIRVDFLSQANTRVAGDLVSDVVWRGDKRLSAYTFNSIGSIGNEANSAGVGYSTRVIFDYGTMHTSRPSRCEADLTEEGDDATGRLRRIQVRTIEGGVLGKVLYERWFTWAGDQVVGVDVCYETPTNEVPAVPTPEVDTRLLDGGTTTGFGFDAQKRLLVNRSDNSGAVTLSRGRVYGYDTFGNRVKELVTSGGEVKELTTGWVSSYAPGGQLTRVATTDNGETENTSSMGWRQYTWDTSGRTTEVEYPGASIQFGFGGSIANGGVDSVLRTVTINHALHGLSYPMAFNYYFDASNRRIRKEHPAGASEDYFYGLGGELLSERSFDTDSNTDSSGVFDEYIYLGGTVVGVVRARYSDGHLKPELRDYCFRRGEPGICEVHQIVGDDTGRPVFVLNHFMEVSGVGEYDAFGHRNRVTVPGVETEHPATGDVGLGEYTRAQLGTPPVRMRALAGYLDWGVNQVTPDVVAGPVGGGAFSVEGGTPFLRTPWADTTTLAVAYLSNGVSKVNGAVLAGIEFDRVSSSMAYFPPMRWPGQYYDEETDLFENHNRYYDPTNGRYLSPEPLLHSPAYLWAMVQAGTSVPAYAYAANNPLRNTDPDGRRVRLMDQAARSDAFSMSLNPQMKYVYDWLDASPALYEMWGDVSLPQPQRKGVHREGTFNAGELSGTNMCNVRGGTIKLDRRMIDKHRASRRAVASHEFTHAGIFDYQTGPRPFSEDGMAVPMIIEHYLDTALPGGALGGGGDVLSDHGGMGLYWDAVVGP